VKEKPKKGQTRIKTGQKREAWRSREKSEAITVDKARKTEENAKRRARNANHTDINEDLLVKDKQEKDKIRTKPDKNEKRDEAGRSQKQLQWIKNEKLKKMQKKGPKMQSLTSCIKERRKKGPNLHILQSIKGGGCSAKVGKM
nr:hypothetical protein [Tanacetum cinerariifolium]